MHAVTPCNTSMSRQEYVISNCTDPYVFYNLTTKLLPEKYDIPYISDIIKNNPKLQFVAICREDNPEYVGFILARTDSRNSTHAVITALGVLQEHRNKGIARKLINTTLQSIGMSGINRVLLHVKTDNTSAMKLYKSIGFKIISREPNYYSDNSDAYTMEIRAKGELQRT